MIFRAEYLAGAAAVLAVVMGIAHMRSLQNDLRASRAEADRHEAAAATYKAAAEKTVSDAQAMIAARDAAAATYRDALARIAGTDDACLDVTIAPGLID